MWVLRLNDMRTSNVEIMTDICRAETREELVRFVKRLIVKPYIDIDFNDIHGPGHGYQKYFEKHSRLEWFNAPLFNGPMIADMGDYDSHMAKASNAWEEFRERCPSVEELS